MQEKAWIVYDARYEFDPDAASVLELYAEREKPTWSQLHEDWGNMSAVLVECDVKHEDGRNLLVNHRTLGMIK